MALWVAMIVVFEGQTEAVLRQWMTRSSTAAYEQSSGIALAKGLSESERKILEAKQELMHTLDGESFVHLSRAFIVRLLLQKMTAFGKTARSLLASPGCNPKGAGRKPKAAKTGNW